MGILREGERGSHKEDKTVLSYEPYVAITVSLVDIRSPYCAKLQETIKANNTWSKSPKPDSKKTSQELPKIAGSSKIKCK